MIEPRIGRGYVERAVKMHPDDPPAWVVGVVTEDDWLAWELLSFHTSFDSAVRAAVAAVAEYQRLTQEAPC